MSSIRRLSARELALARASATAPTLLDVREAWERELVKLEPSLWVPLGQLPGALMTLDPQQELVVYCHHGVRSLHACRFLAEAGFTHLANLEGGIEAWSLEVDPGAPRY